MKKIISLLSICLILVLAFCLTNFINANASETYYNLGSSTIQATRFEAEDYMSSDAKIATSESTTAGYTLASGNTVVEMGNPASAVMTFDVNVEKAGTYVLKYAYWTGSASAYLKVSVNGADPVSMGTMVVNGWANAKRRIPFYHNFEIELVEGENTIVISNGGNYTNLDFVEIYEKDNLYYYPLEKAQLGMNGIGDRIEAEYGVPVGYYSSGAFVEDPVNAYLNIIDSGSGSNGLVNAHGVSKQAVMKYYVSVDKAGTYDLTIAATANAKTTSSLQNWIINYGTENEKNYEIKPNSYTTRTDGGNGYTCITTYEVELVSGLNEIRYYNANTATCNIDYFTIYEQVEKTNLDMVVEAENIAEGIIRIIAHNTKYNMLSGYATEFHTSDAGVLKFDVTVEEDGYYDLYAVGYTGATDPQLNLIIDGVTQVIDFKKTGYISGGSVTNGGNLYQIFLTKGTHTIELTKVTFVTMDYFYVTKSISNVVGESKIKLNVGEKVILNPNNEYHVADSSVAEIVDGKLVAKKSGRTTLSYNVTTVNGIVGTVSYDVDVYADLYAGSATTQAMRFEAEDYMSSDAKIATSTSTTAGYTLASGNTVVEMGNPASAVMTMNINVEKAGTYVLKYAYWTGSAAAYLNVSVNGSTPVSMGTMVVNGWANAKRRIGFYQNFEIELVEGENTIVISNGANYTNLDFVEIYEKDNLYYYPIEKVQLGMNGVGDRIEGEYGIPVGYYSSGELFKDPVNAYLNIINTGNGSNGLASAHGTSKQAVMKFYITVEEAGTYILQIASTSNKNTTTSKQNWTINAGTENEKVYSIALNNNPVRTSDSSGYDSISSHEVELVAGVNEITYYNATSGTCNIDFFTILEPQGNNLDTVIEAETIADGIIRINAHVSKYPMLSGYATEFDGSQVGYLKFSVTVTEEGYYDLYAVGYTGATNPKLNFKLDGVSSEIDVKLSGYISSGNVSSGANLYQIYLTPGTHTLEFSKSTHVTMDYFYVTKSVSNVAGANKVILPYGEAMTLNPNNNYYVTDTTIAEVVDGVLVTKKAGETTLCYDVVTENGVVGTVVYVLTVEAADYTGDDINFEDVIVAYDGENHPYVANAPEGWTVAYFGNDQEMILPGEYDVTVLLTHDSYNSLRFDVKVVITKADYLGNDLIFESEEFTYDGNEHALVAYAPEGWEIVYEYNNKTYPGIVEVRAIFSHNCYNDVEMYATLTVNKAEYTGNDLYVNDVVVEYDGLEHQVEVNVPSGWVVSFSKDGISEVGTYEIIVLLSHNNYFDVVKTATLTITKSIPTVSADINELNTLINTYYNNGVYVKGTQIYLNQEAVAELLLNYGFHADVDILERVTYFTKDALWMSHGDADDKFSYYGTLGNNMTGGVVDNIGDTTDKIAYKGMTMEEFYITLKDVIASESHNWQVKNGVYTSNDAEVIEWFKAIAAPCYLGFQAETRHYITLSSVSIAEVDGTLELCLYASSLDTGKLTSGSTLFAKAIISFESEEPVLTEVADTIVEAEVCLSNYANMYKGNALAHGGAYVGSIDNYGQGVTFNYFCYVEGEYDLEAFYTTGSAGSWHGVYVNGVKQGNLTYSEHTGWGSADAYNAANTSLTITLKEGWNSISVFKDDGNGGWAELDYFVIKGADKVYNPADFMDVNTTSPNAYRLEGEQAGMVVRTYDNDNMTWHSNGGGDRFYSENASNRTMIGGIDAVGQGLEWHLVANESGKYRVTVVYAHAYGDNFVNLSFYHSTAHLREVSMTNVELQEYKVSDLAIGAGAGWGTPVVNSQTFEIDLAEGTNFIYLAKELQDVYCQIDYIELTYIG